MGEHLHLPACRAGEIGEPAMQYPALEEWERSRALRDPDRAQAKPSTGGSRTVDPKSGEQPYRKRDAYRAGVHFRHPEVRKWAVARALSTRRRRTRSARPTHPVLGERMSRVPVNLEGSFTQPDRLPR
jgi:hypothetical protein